MKQYLEMIEHVINYGEERTDRTGTGTIGVFGYQARFDLRKGFPLLTTKKMPLRIIFEELKWFLTGDTNIKTLLDKNVNIWNADAYRWHKTQNPQSTMSEERFLQVLRDSEEDYLGLGELGPIYGKQWRSWEALHGEWDIAVIDQIANVVNSIKNDPFGRRHIVSAWNVGEIDKMALPPCHVIFQFYVSTNGELSCQLYQRSADLFLGVPFNIASYALLVHMVASVTGLKVGEFIHTFGDLHIYKNHIDQVLLQMKREPKELPQLAVRRNFERQNLEDFVWEDFSLIGYDPHSLIKGKVSVGK